MSEHESHGTYRSYLIGFGLSAFLTLIPFAVVMSGADIGLPFVLAIIFVFGAAQIGVHVVYFLHVGLKVEDGWQVMSMVFTTVLVVIVLAGSIWVMLHLHENMMPAHEQIERVRNLP